MPRLIHGYHHITLVAADAPRTVRFYRDLLGLELVKRTVNFEDPSSYHLFFGDAHGTPGTLVTFFEWRRVRRGQTGVGGVHHLALSIDSDAALPVWKRRLEHAGVRVTGPLERDGYRCIGFVDPDGHKLEIASVVRARVAPEPGFAADGATGGTPAAQSGPAPPITADMRIRGLHHITAITDDLAREDEFIERVLGWRLDTKSVDPGDGRTALWSWANAQPDSAASSSTLSLLEWRSTYYARHGVGQAHHVAFRAAAADDLPAWIDHLHGLGVQVTPVQDRHYFQSIFFRSPSGLLLELATDGPGFTVDEHGARLGMELQLPPWLEGRRRRLVESLVPLP